ncbi:hypothetical protein [Cohnella fermenti]|uniref:Uncharacterized protein n=1 Tax=Cohnella fermenti TaxID=2565925 RepID=A0A4S4C556_9BACL|nr:hypothetical protein [Cohnella fermenti]THF80831.1 hypothetical protein E6C55_10135 [Cohnella fermenti]
MSEELVRKRKWRKKKSRRKIWIWLASILGGLIIIACVGGYFAINYTADKVLDAMFESAVKGEDTPSSSPSASDGGAAEPSASDEAASPSEEASSPSASPTDTGTNSPDKSPDAQSGKDGEGGKLPEASASPSTEAAPTYSAEISTDKAEQVKEDISFSEKTKVMTVMLKRLSVDDIKTLQQLANGGLTLEKKKEAKALILEKLTEEEYDELIEIAKKYGLSQGKSYDASQKEDLKN